MNSAQRGILCGCTPFARTLWSLVVSSAVFSVPAVGQDPASRVESLYESAIRAALPQAKLLFPALRSGGILIEVDSDMPIPVAARARLEARHVTDRAVLTTQADLASGCPLDRVCTEGGRDLILQMDIRQHGTKRVMVDLLATGRVGGRAQTESAKSYFFIMEEDDDGRFSLVSPIMVRADPGRMASEGARATSNRR